MTRPFCTKELHTRCRYNSSACDCICHKDSDSGVALRRGKPSPSLETADLILRGIELSREVKELND